MVTNMTGLTPTDLNVLTALTGRTDPDPSDLLRQQLDDLQEQVTQHAEELQGMQERFDRAYALLEEVEADEDGDSGPQKYDPLPQQYDVGDTVEVVVEDDGSGTKHGDPMGRVDGAVTFLSKGKTDDLRPGDTATVVLTDVDERHMRGVRKQTGGEDGDQ